MSDKLKPCPFCGGRASVRPRTTFVPSFVQCAETCGGTAYGPHEWNRRAPDAAALKLARAQAFEEAAELLRLCREAWSAKHPVNASDERTAAAYDGGFTSALHVGEQELCALAAKERQP